MAAWYYTESKQRKGPISWDELKQLAKVGFLSPADLVWTQGMANWEKASTTPGLFGEGAPRGRPGREDDASPRRRSWDDDRPRDYGDGPRPRPRPKKSNALLIVGLCVLGGVLIVGVSVLVIVIANDPGPLPPRFPAQNNRPVVFNNGQQARWDESLNVHDPDDLGRLNGGIGCRCRSHNFRMSVGNTYTIDMESNDIDSHLRLVDDLGLEVAFNDGGGPGPRDARIVFTPTRTAEYRIIASSIAPHQFGRYVLKVDTKKGGDPFFDQPKKKEKDLFNNKGDLIFNNGRASVKNQLTFNDPRDVVFKNSPRKVFPVSLKNGRTYEFNLAFAVVKGNNAQPCIRLEDINGNDLEEQSNIFGGRNVKLTYTCEQFVDRIYVVVTTVNGGTSEFTLTVTEMK